MRNGTNSLTSLEAGFTVPRVKERIVKKWWSRMWSDYRSKRSRDMGYARLYLLDCEIDSAFPNRRKGD